MPRMLIWQEGILIAKPGYDVVTAAAPNMIFSSTGVAATVYQSGIAVVAPYSGTASDRYKRVRVNFAKVFPAPPPVLVAGLNPDGSADVNAIVLGVTGNDYARSHPHYSLEIDTSGFWLYVLYYAPSATGFLFGTDVTSWKWYVLDATLS